MYSPKGNSKMRVGCDLLRISRIEEKLSDDKFLTYFFTEQEIELFRKRKFSPQTITANYCAKEAYVKALGCGFGKIRPKDISVLRKDNGVPYILYNGKEINVSLSHDGDYAFAVVVMED